MPSLVSLRHRIAKLLWPEIKTEVIILENEINTLSNTIDLLRRQLNSKDLLVKSLEESNHILRDEVTKLDLRQESTEAENITLHENVKKLNNSLLSSEKINSRNSKLKVLVSITHKEAKDIKMLMLFFFLAVFIYLWKSSFIETIWLPSFFGIMAFVAYLINLTAPIRDQFDGKLSRVTIKIMQPYVSVRSLLLAAASGVFYALGVWGTTEFINILGLAFSLAFLMVPALLLPRRQDPAT